MFALFYCVLLFWNFDYGWFNVFVLIACILFVCTWLVFALGYICCFAGLFVYVVLVFFSSGYLIYCFTLDCLLNCFYLSILCCFILCFVGICVVAFRGFDLISYLVVVGYLLILVLFELWVYVICFVVLTWVCLFVLWFFVGFMLVWVCFYLLIVYLTELHTLHVYLLVWTYVIVCLVGMLTMVLVFVDVVVFALEYCFVCGYD